MEKTDNKTDKKLLRACAFCKNKKCKDNNYSMLDECSNNFHWVVFGICAAVLFMLMAGTYLIVRVIDGNWADWKTPTILGIIYLVIVSVFAMVFSLKTIKREMSPISDKNP